MLKKFSILMLILITSYSCALEKEETSSTYKDYNFTVGMVSIDSYNNIKDDNGGQYQRVCVTYKTQQSDIPFIVYSSGKYGANPTDDLISKSKLLVTGADLYFEEINGTSKITVPISEFIGTEISYNGNAGRTVQIPANSPYFAIVGNDYKDYQLTIYITASEISGNGVTTVQNGQFTDTFKLPIRITGSSDACLK